jgi:signal transduction histidine kinase
MAFSRKLEKLAQVVDDVQVELRKLVRELRHVYDEELAALIEDWVRALKEADVYLEEAKDIMLDVAEDMRREGL